MTLVKTPPVLTGKAATAASANGKNFTAQSAPPPPVKLTPQKTGELPPLEDRLLKLNVLFDLQGKYNRLQESETKLRSFNLKKVENLYLTIRDGDRNEFQTSNTEVIAEVIKSLCGTIQDKRKSIEPLLVVSM